MFSILLKINKYVKLSNPIFICSNLKQITYFMHSSNTLSANFDPIFLNKNVVVNAKIHKYFYNLILKKWLFFNTNYRFYAIVYNYFVFRALYQVTYLVTTFKNANKNILFVTDDILEKAIGFRSINFLTLNKNFSALIPFFSNATFWSRESSTFCNAYFLSSQIVYQKVDLAIVLCKSYEAFSRKELLGISNHTIGFVDANSSPALFDFFIPVIKNKFFSLQLFKELLYAQLLVKF